MLSDDILIHFKPIDLTEAIAYLNDLPYTNIYDVKYKFSKLSEEDMANFVYPASVHNERERLENSYYGKESADFKTFNTIITTINLIKACAKINVAIYNLQAKYRKFERQSGINSYTPFSTPSWASSTDEDVLKIKNAAINARDRIHGYSKKYTIEGFEQKFIDKIKWSVYVINNTFRVDTRTIGEKAEDASANVIGVVVGFGILVLVFFLMSKCATSL